jgi:BirA family biotin operon repressor/biotin-[acetyl-CoA-carboxylase] ligase
LWKIYSTKKNHIKFISQIIDLSRKDFIFKDFYYFSKLYSTQDFAFKISKRKKKINPSVILSDIQTTGKGRKGNMWSSPKGGLWMSLILETKLKVENLFFFIMISAICICETIEKETNLKPDLKWPNDIFLNGKKIAGILLDIDTDIDKGINRIILGIGINTNNDLNLTLNKIKKNNSLDYPITTLENELKNEANIPNVHFLSTLLNNLNTYLLKINSNSFLPDENILNNYRERIVNSKNNLHYSFKTNDNISFEGELIDVIKDGTILVNDVQQKKIIKIFSVNNISIK